MKTTKKAYLNKEFYSYQKGQNSLALYQSATKTEITITAISSTWVSNLYLQQKTSSSSARPSRKVKSISPD